jgi:hypothetical protein
MGNRTRYGGDCGPVDQIMPLRITVAYLYMICMHMLGEERVELKVL